jgi:hypothetical protein
MAVRGQAGKILAQILGHGFGLGRRFHHNQMFWHSVNSITTSKINYYPHCFPEKITRHECRTDFIPVHFRAPGLRQT